MSTSVKRSAELEPSSVAKKARSSSPAVSAAQRSGPLTQEDVVHYKKQAIWRALNLSRTQERLANTQLAAFQEENRKLSECVGVLCEWYGALCRSLGEVFDSSEKSAFSEITKLVDIPEGIDSSLDAKLKTKQQQLAELVAKLPPIPPSIDTAKLETLNDTVSKLEVEKNSVLLMNETLQRNLNQIQEELLALISEHDRANSDSLKRVHDTVVKKEEEEEIKPEEAAKETTEVSSQEVEDLRLKLGELQTVNSDFSAKLTAEIERSAELQRQLTEQQTRLTNLTEADLETCLVHQQVVKDNERLKAELSGLNMRYEEICVKLDALEPAKSTQTEEANSQQELTRVEGDLVRIRTQRDELLSKNSVLSSQKPSEEIIAEFQSTIKTLEARIEQLTAEKTVSVEDLESADAEQVKKQNKILAVELKQLEELFKATKELQMKKITKYVENEQIINKLTVERTKAVEKYFATMRLNESLQQENKALKSNMQKQTELIATLKDVERQILRKSEALEKQVQTQFSSIEKGLVVENKHHASKIESLAGNVKLLTQTNAGLKQELAKAKAEHDAQVAAFKKLEMEASRVSAKLKESEKLIGKYRSSGQSAVSAEEDDEIKQALLSMAKCSLCNKNWKDTAFKTCGHCFCNKCVKDRLDARMRKCPSCNLPVSSYDVLTIHL